MLKWFKRLVLALLFVGVLLAVAWLCRGPLLRGAARAWIVDQPLARADAIVVLGGGLDTRPFEAAQLYYRGMAPRILVMNPKLTAATELGLLPAEGALARTMLLKLKVPAGAIQVPAELVTNSFDESIVVRNWARANHVRRLIIPTDIFHTRRVRWLFRKELKNTGIQVTVDAVPVREYTRRDWWRHESGIVAFQNEVLKFAYYWVKY